VLLGVKASITVIGEQALKRVVTEKKAAILVI
jgi:hypothetical protein